jgi:hypothetical protein
MDLTANYAWLVLLLGIVSTTQTHLAKALERQGIETWDLIRARFQRKQPAAETPIHQERLGRKPVIYTLGLILNHTTFLYHLLIAPLGAAIALYTGMYGIGLFALLLYTTWVMKEEITRPQLVGAVSILIGTLVIGVEGIARPPLDMGQIDLLATVAAVALLLGLCLALVLAGLRSGTPRLIGLAFGLAAGACGSLDPFLKGVGQSAGQGGLFTPRQPPRPSLQLYLHRRPGPAPGVLAARLPPPLDDGAGPGPVYGRLCAPACAEAVPGSVETSFLLSMMPAVSIGTLLRLVGLSLAAVLRARLATRSRR